MPVDAGLIAWIEEAMAPVGTVTRRAMMGGATLYLDGTIFAIVADDLLWFKADAESDAAWDAAGCSRFTFRMGEGREGSMNYRRAPDDVYDDADALRSWAALGVAAGQRAPARKPRASRKPA
ncbi:MAG: TfoX/Sxy family protein [Sphingomonas sp.]|nr:TfoX/Sxy family protein [Sphingomonas sp.]